MRIEIPKTVYKISQALELYEQIKQINSDEIIIDFSKSTYIQNQFYALFGLVLKKYHSNKKITIIEPKHYRAKQNLKNIGFLKEFSKAYDGDDIFKTMVKYTHIPLAEKNRSEEFYNYFFTRFNNVIKNLSPKLLKEINRIISELFNNVFMHSRSDLGLFCVGQFYPTKNTFSFIIADGGIGIKKNVEDYLNLQIDSIKAIEWALEEGHSTSGGGFGLNLVIELVNLQKGRFDIISSNGRIKIKNAQIAKKYINIDFEGTIVYIELKTDNYYKLKDE